MAEEGKRKIMLGFRPPEKPENRIDPANTIYVTLGHDDPGNILADIESEEEFRYKGKTHKGKIREGLCASMVADIHFGKLLEGLIESNDAKIDYTNMIRDGVFAYRKIREVTKELRLYEIPEPERIDSWRIF